VIKGKGYTSKKCFINGKNNPELPENIDTVDCYGWEIGKIH